MESRHCYFTLFLACLIFSCIFGCTSATKSPFDNGHLERLSRQNKLRENKEQDSRIRSFMALEKKNRLQLLKKSYPLPNEISAESLYSEVLRYYQIKSSEGLNVMVGEFLVRYPNSIFADNALYLQGQLELALGNPSKALAAFEQVIKMYPSGNKYVSALFGKGVAYRKLQIYGFSKNVFQEVKKKFPGSPEFYKAELEEKLLGAEKGI